MAEKKLRPGQKIKMVSVDELLGCAGEESSLEIDINRIQPFQNHPFKVVDDAKMDDLVNSIRQNGVLTPVLVRPTDDGGYEMISGHRRMHAAERAGLATIPAIIRELTDDDATIVMVEANSQREEILPSEKAFAYKMRYEATKRKAGRPDKNSPQVGTNFRADEELAKEVGESKNQVYRFIRLTDLIPELLEISDITISMKAMDHFKMPELISNRYYVAMDADESSAYESLKSDLVLPYMNGEITAANAATLTGKLVQMANGAVYADNGEEVLIHNKKLDALEDLIEAANGRPVMVAYWYKHDLVRIEKRLNEMKIYYEKLDSDASIKKWNNGDLPVALIHPASAGHGLNLQSGGNILIWFGLTWSLELYQQTVARLWRQGQSAETVIV